MNVPKDEHDPRLAALFEREHRQLPVEPFFSAALQRIEQERQRHAWTRRVLQGVGLFALVWISPWLIEASTLASDRFGDGFAAALAWLLTPLGTMAAIAVIAGTSALLTISRWLARQ